MTTASFSRSALVGAVLSLAACAAPTGGTGDASDVYDPLEGVNRGVFAFNEVADKAVIRPVAEGYSIVVPDPIRDDIRTFVRTLTSPLDITHNLLEGRFDNAATMTGRTLTNIVLGFGFADVATAAGIGYKPADMGQTLAVWGVDSGPYIVIPLLGPSNVRDTVGMAVDSVADPVGWALTTPENLGRTAVAGIDTRSRYLKEVDELRRSSLDYYATMRSLSQQQRKAAVGGADAAQQKLDFPNYDAPQKPAN